MLRCLRSAARARPGCLSNQKLASRYFRTPAAPHPPSALSRGYSFTARLTLRSASGNIAARRSHRLIVSIVPAQRGRSPVFVQHVRLFPYCGWLTAVRCGCREVTDPSPCPYATTSCFSLGCTVYLPTSFGLTSFSTMSYNTVAVQQRPIERDVVRRARRMDRYLPAYFRRCRIYQANTAAKFTLVCMRYSGALSRR
jgi:hypothetical protein